jgi:hypothetical protein
VILFVDDEKLPEWFGLPRSTNHAKDANEFDEMFWRTKPTGIYLDHDIGDGRDGSKALAKILGDGGWTCLDKVFCISLNHIGVERIKGVCSDYHIEFEDIGRKVMFQTAFCTNKGERQ